MRSTTFILMVIVILTIPLEGVAYNFKDHHQPIPHDFSVSKPAPGSNLIDAKFQNPITRIVKPPRFSGKCLVPEYSKRQLFNSDETLLRLNDCDGRTHIYNAKTYQYIKTLRDQIQGAQDIFWHPTDPKLLYFNSEAILYLYNIKNDSISTIYSFKTTTGKSYDSADTFAEGNLSNDGRFYAVIGKVGDNGYKEIFVLDIPNKKLISRRNMPAGVDFVDWVSISPKGNYVVIDYATSSRGIEVYPRDLSRLIWTRPLGLGHSDLALDADGSEVLIMDIYDANLNKTVFRKFRLSDGKQTDLLVFGLFDSHISCRNMDRPGWCLISTFDSEDNQSTNAGNWELFADEIFFLKLDGSGMRKGGVERIAHHHSRRYGVEGVYEAEPHATVNRKGDRIVFGSNWRQDIYNQNSIDTYVLDLRSGSR